MYSVRRRKVKYKIGVCLCVGALKIVVFRKKEEVILDGEKRRLEKCVLRIVNYTLAAVLRNFFDSFKKHLFAWVAVIWGWEIFFFIFSPF